MIRELELPVFTFGWELEATGRARRSLSRDIVVGHDGSVSGDGLEYRTRREAVWDPERSLAALRSLVMDPGLKIDSSCGFHVHIGLGMKTRKLHSWAGNFVTLARLIETDVMAAVPESRRANSFCRSWRDYRGSVIAPTYHGNKHANDTRYCWINPVEIFRPGGIRTIEVRLLGDTKNYLYLLAWTSFCRRMAASSWALIHDPSRLEQEVHDLREAAKVVKECFITRTYSGIDKARRVTLLAAKAGFYQALTPSLTRIREVERAIRYEMDKDARDRDTYERQVQEMREYVQREKASLVGTHEEVRLGVGTVVQAIVTDPEGYTIPGQSYVVAEDNLSEQMTQLVRGDGAGGWWVPRNSLRYVERRPEPVVA